MENGELDENFEHDLYQVLTLLLFLSDILVHQGEVDNIDIYYL